MKTCTECGVAFRAKRTRQAMCSIRCRQSANAKKRKGQKTGARIGWEYRRQTDKDGYFRVYAGNHPFADGRYMIGEHILRMELKIGRRIAPGEIVHHKNGNRQDNRLSNLVLMTRVDHCKLHGPDVSARRDRIAGRYA